MDIVVLLQTAETRMNDCLEFRRGTPEHIVAIKRRDLAEEKVVGYIKGLKDIEFLDPILDEMCAAVKVVSPSIKTRLRSIYMYGLHLEINKPNVSV